MPFPKVHMILRGTHHTKKKSLFHRLLLNKFIKREAAPVTNLERSYSVIPLKKLHASDLHWSGTEPQVILFSRRRLSGSMVLILQCMDPSLSHGRAGAVAHQGRRRINLRCSNNMEYHWL